MKKVIMLLSAVMSYSCAFSQTDSVKISSSSGSAELILENSSKAKAGAFLKNVSNGRTQFAYAVDTSFVSGDTLYLHRGDGWSFIPLNEVGKDGLKVSTHIGVDTGTTIFSVNSAAEPSEAKYEGKVYDHLFETATGEQYVDKVFRIGYNIGLRKKVVENKPYFGMLFESKYQQGNFSGDSNTTVEGYFESINNVGNSVRPFMFAHWTHENKLITFLTGGRIAFADHTNKQRAIFNFEDTTAGTILFPDANVTYGGYGHFKRNVQLIGDAGTLQLDYTANAPAGGGSTTNLNSSATGPNGFNFTNFAWVDMPGITVRSSFSNFKTAFYPNGDNTLPLGDPAARFSAMYANKGRFNDLYIASSLNTNPAPSAIVELNSTSKGFLPPRMTQAQRLAIQSPAEGLMVYQTDAGATGKGWYGYNGATWEKLN